MTPDSFTRATRLKHMLRADGACLWQVGADGSAVPESCDPVGLLAGAFAMPDLDEEGVHFLEGPQGVRLLPLAVRDALEAPSERFAVLHALGRHGSGCFAFWRDLDGVPVNCREIADFAIHDWDHEALHGQALEELSRMSAYLHGMAFALPQGLLLVPRGAGPGLVNPAAARWLGLAPGSVERSVLAEALRRLVARADNADQVREQVEGVLRGTGRLLKDALLRFPGEPLVLRFTLASLDSAVHGGWVWLLDDVTGREG